MSVDVLPAPVPLASQPITGQLHVSSAGASLRLRWANELPSVTGHGIYTGTLASLRGSGGYDHAALSCHLPRVPVDATEFEAMVSLPGTSSYVVVTPSNSLDEGGAGTSSHGLERPVAGTGEPCGPMP